MRRDSVDRNAVAATGPLIRGRYDDGRIRPVLKEKFVDIYESFFQGRDPSGGREEFWDELFLLKVNVAYLAHCFYQTSEEELLAIKVNINMIFAKCVNTLHDTSGTRVLHALQTLVVILRGIFYKKWSNTNFGYDVINVLCGIDSADALFQDLIESVRMILVASAELDMHSHKATAMSLLLTLTTAIDNIHQNTLIEYIVKNPRIFSTLIYLMVNRSSTQQPPSLPSHSPSTSSSPAKPLLKASGQAQQQQQQQQGPITPLTTSALFLVVMLFNFRKYETKNAFIDEMVTLDDESTLKEIANILNKTIEDCDRWYWPQIIQPQQKPSFFGAVSDFLSGNRIPEGDWSKLYKQSGAILLAFYELMYQNNYLIPALCPQLAGAETESLQGIEIPPLIRNFIIFSAYQFSQETPEHRGMYYIRLCLIILMCMVEDNPTQCLLHHPFPAFPVPPLITVVDQRQCVPLITVVIDILLQFIKTNLRKNLPVTQYCLALGVIHRILCWQKRTKRKLDYPWKKVWTGLFNVIKFICVPEIFKDKELMPLSLEIIKIFNVFITYGDVLLVNEGDYDMLYYEIIRQSKIINLFAYYVDRYENGGGTDSEHSSNENGDASPHLMHAGNNNNSAGSVGHGMDNMNTIVRHFTSKIDQWEADHPEHSLSAPEQVLELIKSNYKTLKLTLEDHLDTYVPYLENPAHVRYFRQFVRAIVADYKVLLATSLDPDTALNIATTEPTQKGGSYISHNNNSTPTASPRASPAKATIRGSNGGVPPSTLK